MTSSLAHPPLIARRIGYAVAFAGLLSAALLIAGPGTWQVWAFFIGPDIALVAGASRGLQHGQLHPRAVRLYNAVHVFARKSYLFSMTWSDCCTPTPVSSR